MTRPSGRFPRRRHTPKEPRRILRVLTEGERTEPGYLTLWARRNRGIVRLDLADTGMTPDALVRRAKEHLQGSPRSRRAGRDFDEIWCVFDTDEHENLSQAMEDARQTDIEVAVSNPCFGLWLVLHVQEQTAHIHRHDVQQLSSELGLSDGKRIANTARTSLVEASGPRDSAPRHSMIAMPATVPRPDRIRALTCGGSWIGSRAAREPA